MPYIQIGLAVMRDKVTGEPSDERIPIYAETEGSVLESGFTKSEEKLLTDVAGVYVDIFRKYQEELKKVKALE